jgi:hypothetical protein
MLAFWIVAIILWRWGLEEGKPFYLAGSGLLIGACALTKYFGACLIPLRSNSSTPQTQKCRPPTSGRAEDQRPARVLLAEGKKHHARNFILTANRPASMVAWFAG